MDFSQRLGLLLAVGIGAVVFSLLDEEQRRRRHATDRHLTHEKLNVWDAEGGNIPNVATVRPHSEDPTSVH